jgi:glycosyltransferase involved in cell wall biosynthesis
MQRIRVLAMLESQDVSGSAKAVLEFAKEADRGHSRLPKIELSVQTFDRGQGENSLTKAIQEIGITHDIVSERRPFDSLVIPQLQALIEKRQVDLLWTHSVKSHFLVRWAGLNQSRKWIAFHHGYTAVDTKMRLYNQLDRWSLQSANEVFTSSAAFIGELQRRNVRREHIHVQHMPIRPFVPASEKQRTQLRQQLGLDAQTRVLLCVGRLSQEKGHADLIRAFPKMRALAGESRFHLVLVGEGPERQRIEELCRKLCLTNFITLAGQQADVNPYYSIADVFVLPSHSEGCPNVLLEAMAAGIPVVATAVGGIPEVVTNGREAILVKKCDHAALASATAQLLRDRQFGERMVTFAHEIVARKTPEEYFKSIAAVFSHACTNGN